MNSKYEWFERLKAVEREYQVVQEALWRMRVAVDGADAALPPGTSDRDLVAARGHLGATFLVRLWAEFESGIRTFHRSVAGPIAAPLRTMDLIDTVAGATRGRGIEDRVRRGVHEVRKCRNSLIHARDDPAPPVPLSVAKGRLNTYLSHLPDRWN